MLLDAAATADGPARLIETVRMWRSVHHLLRGRIPTRLAEVARCCRAAMPTDPVDRPSLVRGWTPRRPLPATGQPCARRSPPPRPAAHGIAARLRRTGCGGATATASGGAPPAPTGPRRRCPVPPRRRPSCPAGLPRAVDGLAVDGYTLRVPRTARDLQAWGDRLGNCLATYTSAVVDGRSTIVGVFRDQRIVACVEIDPERRVRQFLGRANTQPDPALEAQVLPVLRRHGLVAA